MMCVPTHHVVSVTVLSRSRVSLLSEVSQQTLRNRPSSCQVKTAVSSDCKTASSSTCTSARHHVETLDSTAHTRAPPHVRRGHLDDDDDADPLFSLL